MDEEECLRIVDAADDDARETPLPPDLKDRLDVFAEAYADVEELDPSETIMAIRAAWPIYRAYMEEHGGRS